MRQVGLAPAGGQAVPILPQWGRYVSQVNDLPLEGLTSLHVRFDLMGPGEVWIDNVQLYHLLFSRAEMVELSKLITLADVKLQSRQIGDCLQLLDGYWPQFLGRERLLAAADAADAGRPKRWLRTSRRKKSRPNAPAGTTE